MKKPLVILSGLTAAEAEFVAPIVAGWQRPLWLEATSRLRGDPRLQDFEIRGAEKTLRTLDYDGVIRIGAVPTLRLWRDLEKNNVEVQGFSARALTGLARTSVLNPLSKLDATLQFNPWTKGERRSDREFAARRETLLGDFPLSEPAWVARLSSKIPRDARLFLGNSLPIREWDFAAAATATRDVFANRGTNGIDGLISTFCGVASPERSNWALLGDLSVLYDLSGPWALRARPVNDWNLAVINNAGGQIFKRMFPHPLFLNAHDLEFGEWAKMWKLGYVRLDRELEFKTGRPQVIEIVPEADQTAKFWRAWEDL